MPQLSDVVAISQRLARMIEVGSTVTLPAACTSRIEKRLPRTGPLWTALIPPDRGSITTSMNSFCSDVPVAIGSGPPHGRLNRLFFAARPAAETRLNPNAGTSAVTLDCPPRRSEP